MIFVARRHDESKLNPRSNNPINTEGRDAVCSPTERCDQYYIPLSFSFSLPLSLPPFIRLRFALDLSLFPSTRRPFYPSYLLSSSSLLPSRILPFPSSTLAFSFVLCCSLPLSLFRRRLFILLLHFPPSFTLVSISAFLSFSLSLRRCRFVLRSIPLALLPCFAFPSDFSPLSLLAVYAVSLFSAASTSLLATSPFDSPSLSLFPWATLLIAAPAPRPNRDVTIVGRHLAIRQPRPSVIVPLYSRIPARLFQPPSSLTAPTAGSTVRILSGTRISLPPPAQHRLLLATSEFAGTQINEITQGFRPYLL